MEVIGWLLLLAMIPIGTSATAHSAVTRWQYWRFWAIRLEGYMDTIIDLVREFATKQVGKAVERYGSPQAKERLSERTDIMELREENLRLREKELALREEVLAMQKQRDSSYDTIREVREFLKRYSETVDRRENRELQGLIQQLGLRPEDPG